MSDSNAITLASPPGVARMFFWTSLIGSPLALKFLLSI